MGRMKYVQRRANRYEVRLALPDDLAGAPVPPRWPERLEILVNRRIGRFKTEIIRSLRTNDPKQADRRALGEIARILALVDDARSVQRRIPESTISPEQIETLAREHELEILQGDEILRERGLGLAEQPLREPASEGMSEDDFELYAHTIESLNTERRADLARMRPREIVKIRVNRAVAEHGIALHPDDPAWRQLELAFVRAQRSAFDSIKARLQGDVVPTPEHRPRTASVTIREALQRWGDGGIRGARQPRPQTRGEAEVAVRMFVELHGDMAIAQITKRHAREFRDALAKLPKRVPEHYRRMRLPELLAQEWANHPRRNAQTINKALSLLGGVLARAERDGFLDSAGWLNPFYVGFEVPPEEKGGYEPFAREELQRLFASPVFTAGQRPAGGAGKAAFWFPLIALFSGARRTEIAQLRVCDLRADEQGIWFFDLTGSGEGQSVKTSSSARHTPVHPQLVELGLLEYHARRAHEVSSAGPLWPGFEPPVEPKAKAWSKWFARYFGRHVTEDPAKTFHSFRHTFKRACREAGISEEVHNALTGHSGGGVGRSYGRERQDGGGLDRGMSLTRLHAELARVTYPDVKLELLVGTRR